MKLFAKALLMSAFLPLMFTGLVRADGEGRYRKQTISDARFGEGDREKFLNQAYRLAEEIRRDVRGQDTAAQILQNRLVQYFEGFGTRVNEPVYMNLIGLPGVGKTAMLSKIKTLGFPVVHYDAQNYSGENGADFNGSLYENIQAANAQKKPLIIMVEELDKVPEITAYGEKTSTVIGTLNQILSDGRISRHGHVEDAHNVMVLTSMNFAPNEMERFTEEVLKEKKSFYDLTIQDMTKFSEWIRTAPSARYKILSHLFRSNTVRRVAPFTVIMEPLLEETYRAIITGVAKKSVERNTTGTNENKKVKIQLDDSVTDFLFKETVYAPSGAGETVLRADAIVDQLVNFAIKADDGDSSVDRPRSAVIKIDAVTSKARLEVTPYIYHHPRLEALPTFILEADFDRNSGLFLPPKNLAITKPVYVKAPGKSGADGEKPITKKATLEFRYPKSKNVAAGLQTSVQKELLGQQDTVELIQNEMDKYMALSKPSAKEPMFKVLSGFPGIGKSELVRLTAAHLKLPVVKVNMQQFVSDTPTAIDNFVSVISSEMDKNAAAIKAANGKYILLIEELDKTYEIAPNGSLMSRPIMGVIKDLLNEGKIQVATKSVYGNGTDRQTLDISGAFTFITMNFSVDRFGFTADPRMTTIDDVIKAWKQIKFSVAGTKDLLGSMFLPETVSRIMSQFIIMKPSTAEDYKKIIAKQVEKVIDRRIFDKDGKNIGKIRIELSPRYKQFLFNETVIPSEGARNTVVRTQGLISTDLEKAISAIPKSTFGANPVLITLDFFPGSDEVVIRAQLDNAGSKSKIILKRPMALSFPRIDIKGKIPQERLHTAAHEMGHALIAARLGLRIDQVVVVPTLPGAGGYVKFKGEPNKAHEMMANVYAALASRAMERIFLSEDPKSDSSVMEISAGPSQDIKQATSTLFNMIYELGFDPKGGTLDRNFIMGGGKYADYASIPPEMADKLGMILRDMENQVLKDLLQDHSQDWYVDKIVKLAQKGAMNETEFYDLMEYKHPGAGSEAYGRTSAIQNIFKKFIKEKSSSMKVAQKQKRGLLKETVEETVTRYLGEFKVILNKNLHENSPASRQCHSLFL